MRTVCSREIFTKNCRQQQNFDSDLKEAWHYNHVTFTPITKNFMLYGRLIYMLSMLYVRLAIKIKVGIPDSFKVGWCPYKITGSSPLNSLKLIQNNYFFTFGVNAFGTYHLLKIPALKCPPYGCHRFWQLYIVIQAKRWFICLRGKGGSFFLSYFKALSVGPVLRI